MKELIELKNTISNIDILDNQKKLLISIIEDKIENEITSLDVANYFLNKVKENNFYIDNWYLQSLVYLANGVRLSAYNTPLFNDDIYAWDFGPVIKNLYERLMPYGNGLITDFIYPYNEGIFKPDAIVCMNKTWDIFYIQFVKDFKSEALNNVKNMIVKEGSPWYKTFIDSNKKYHIIEIDLISRGFGKWIKKKH